MERKIKIDREKERGQRDRGGQFDLYRYLALQI